MPTLNFTFENNPLVYQVNPDEITLDGKAKLTLEQIDADFTEDFSDDTDFEYDSDFAEFPEGEGKAQQVDKTPTNETFFSHYTNNVNGTRGLGILTGSGIGSPEITDGKLDLSGASQQYVDYNADLNVDSQQNGCIRWLYTPNYSGTPSQVQYMICIARGNDDGRNLIQVYHSNNGQIYLYVKDQSGNTIYQAAAGAWSPVIDTEYEFEFNYAFSAPAFQRLFINGILFVTRNSACVRDENINLFRIGDNVNPNSQSNFFIDDLQVFSTVQHTSNYTPSQAQQYKYLESSIILPEMEHAGDGTIKLFNSFLTIETGLPRILLEIGRSGNKLYWDGDSWEISDESYEQATDSTTFNTNCNTLPVDGENYGQFTIIFPDSDTQNSMSELTANMNIDIYHIDNPYGKILTGFRTDELEGFFETAIKTGNDEIKYILENEGNYYYWNGSAWTTGSLQYSNSSIASDIHTNCNTLTEESSLWYIYFFLHSEDGTTTPELDTLQIDYSYAGETPDILNKCLVWGYTFDGEGNPLTDVIKIRLNKYIVLYGDYSLILKNDDIEVTPDDTGYWEIELIENENMIDPVDGEDVKYVFDFGDNNTFEKTVPDETTKAYNDLE